MYRSHQDPLESPHILSFDEQPPFLKLNTCKEAEARFALTLTELRRNRPLSSRRYGCEVFMHDDLPAFVRKSFGVQSTLSLVPIKINDSIHPPGSLLNLDALYRPGHGASSVRANRLDRRGVEEIIGIGFLRLSQLAYPCSERRVGDIVHNGYPDYMLSDPEEALLTNLEPEDLQSFVHEAITPKHITVHKVARAVGRLIPT